MPNTIGLNGGQPQKPTRFAPIYTGRFFSGIWTNRSPLRDAVSNRMQEKYYGATGDALIDGRNVEITNRLTLARRPGNLVFDANTFSAVDNFDTFRMFGPSSERINVMIDEANNLYSLYNTTKTLVWNKSTGAGQTYMQSVGNSLYFGNGVDNKKWLQSLVTWSANATWNGATTPFMTTFLIDTNGNIQQLTACIIPVSSVSLTSNVLTITSSTTLTGILKVDLQIKFPTGMTASFLDGKTVTITNVNPTTFTADLVASDYADTPETGIHATVVSGGYPISGGSQPTWSTTPLTPGMATPALALTNDGTAQWTNRGTPVENWGIVAPVDVPKPTLGSSRVAWAANTFYSNPGVVIDSNGNLQQVTTDGTSGTSEPSWATVVGNTTTDGTVEWTMIQTAASLVWAAHTSYAEGSFIVASAGGEDCLFRLKRSGSPYLAAGTNADMYGHNGNNRYVGSFPERTTLGNISVPSLMWEFQNSYSPNSDRQVIDILNGAGETTGVQHVHSDNPDGNHIQAEITGTFTVNTPGQYTFTVDHNDALIWSIGDGAELISGAFVDGGISISHTTRLSFSPLTGTNYAASDTCVWNFPTAGNYRFEMDWCNNYGAGSITVKCNGQTILTTTSPESGATQPVWVGWSTSFAPNYPSSYEAANQYQWENLGPATDFTWQASIGFTLPNTKIIDFNGNTEAPYRTGVSGTEMPTFATGLNQLTNDNPNLIWINQGTAAAPPTGTLSTYNGGWKYGISLVNTLDNTVSNSGPLSAATGNFIGVDGIHFAPGEGLPPASQIDPQADYVAIWRTTDGLTSPFLITGNGNTIYTLPLSEYLASGYVDTATDEELNNLISAPINGENTPPPAGAVNLTYHLNRIWFSVGNVVYWTSGPDTPVGNGVNGVSPLNYDEFPSLVHRIVPTVIGALVFTVSDVFIITGQGTGSNPIQTGQPFLRGVGLLSYNALDINGSIIGLYTTDKQFIILDPTSGVSYAGFPIGDRFRKNDSNPGTTWNPANVYVTWHVDGEDQAWYVADGQYGWYRLMPTPAPETGLTWSPFANISGGCKAVKSIEVSPGSHKLLLGPTGTGTVLKRDLDTFSDNGTAYEAYAVVGSIVLAQPGQVAEVAFIATDSVRVGTPLLLHVIIDEALPYYTGPFETLKVWEDDPINQPASRSLIGQRFYMSELPDQAAVCRHMQVRISWPSEAAANELLTLTVYGAYLQEN